MVVATVLLLLEDEDEPKAEAEDASAPGRRTNAQCRPGYGTKSNDVS